MFPDSDVDQYSCHCPHCGLTPRGTQADHAPYIRNARVEELLSTNRPLLAAEEVTYRDLLARSSERLSIIENEMQRLRAQLALVETQRKEALVMNQDLKSINSPIRRLPDDSLREIFLASCRSWADVNSLFFSINMRGQPWILSQVCRRWRSVALSFQKIWACFRIDMEHIPITRMAQQRASFALGQQIRRAGRHELTLSTCDPDEGRLGTSYDMILPLLLSTCSQWRTFELKCHTRAVIHFAPIRGYLESLEKIHLSIRTSSRGEQDISTSNIFEFAPKLRRISLGSGRKDIVRSFIIPWPQIIEYTDGGRRKGSHHLEVLRRATAITDVRINSTLLPEAEGGVPYTLGGRTIRVPTLRNLRARLKLNDSHFQAMFDKLELPGLRVLSTALPPKADPFISLIDRSQCHLTTLLITANTPEISAELLRLCKVTLHLRALCITSDGEESGPIPISDFLVGLVHPLDGDCFLLPALTCLNLMQLNWNPRDSVVLELIDSRLGGWVEGDEESNNDSSMIREGVAQLRKVMLPYSFEIAHKEELERFRSLGLKIITRRS
ncbi:uncharacterized protein BT62DRAFT_486056 [Guyanagaster necrorhizus]|uniref:F-box domain-containing protein n=1 Tax=Guyanagaster necrorhizus TaxID=856835 RepID=A0A9P7VK36_9AGAR|nr:uncharacterized protein BT62DRAFT_486056 [Guyanagaster necrorhizus MCA 3950]KAG7441389.1 hypothetical protein BT62DRAFT_486056 [Guyanagaster necrorhizus MCA 3950]